MSRLTLGAIAFLTAARLVLAAGVGLGDDEAYYWEWSRRLASSYYDHPPAVAWFIAASTRLLGDTPLAVRLPFVLSGLVATAGLWALTRAAAGERAAALAILAFHASPLFGVLTVFAAPDMPMLAAWTVAVWGAGRALAGHRWGWAVAGAAAGVAGLCKYNAVLLPIGLFGALASRRDWRPWLRRWEPWAAAGGALLVASPVLGWNAAHDNASFAFHLSRLGLGGSVGPRAAQFVGSQVALVSPLLLWAALAGVGRLGPLLAWAGLPTLALFAVVAPFTDSKAHWAAAGWMVLMAGAGAWLAERPRWAVATLGTAGLLTALVYGQAAVRLLPIPPRLDPTTDLFGWDRVGERVLALRAASPAADRTFAFGHMYQTAAQLAFATRGSDLPVERLGPRCDQYDQWRALATLRGQDAWFVAHDRYFLDASAVAADLAFAGCEKAETIPIERGGEVVRTFTLWRCRNHSGRDPSQAPR